MALPDDVGRRIAEVRIARGWTQEECAVRLRLTVRRLRRFEAGANLTLNTLERVARGLGVSPRALLDAPAAQEPRRRGRPRKAPPYEPPQGAVELEVAEPSPRRERKRVR